MGHLVKRKVHGKGYFPSQQYKFSQCSVHSFGISLLMRDSPMYKHTAFRVYRILNKSVGHRKTLEQVFFFVVVDFNLEVLVGFDKVIFQRPS